MKKYITILFVSAAALLSASCSNKLLELENPNALTSASAYSYEADLNAALIGVYHAFNGGFYNLDHSLLFSGQTDLCISYSPDTGLVDFVSFKYPDYSRGWNRVTWNSLYNQIARCNQVITYAENVQEWKVYNKEELLAQARAVRAWDYYQLAVLYNHAPYVDYVAPAGDQPAGTPYETLMQKVVEDAEYAYKTLPSTYNEGPWKGQYRLTKWFAGVVLAKTYMNWNNQYDKARDILKNIIENGYAINGQKLALNADYIYNSDTAHENNSEAIFEIQFAQTVQSAGGYWAALGFGSGMNDGATPDRGNWRWKFMGATPVGWGDYDAEAWMLHAFKNEKTVTATPRTQPGQYDQRLECSLLYTDIFTDYPGHMQWQWSENQPQYWKEGRAYINKYVNWMGGDYVQTIQDEEPTNYRVFRLGEIIMDYAECLAQTGDLQGAIDQIDIVRQRAGLAKLSEREPVESKWTNPLTGATLDLNADYGYAAIKAGNPTLKDVMSVIDIEDMKESCFEGDRLVDLRRWGVADMSGDFYKKVAARSSKYKDNFQPHKAWMPIPNSEVNNNPNLDQVEGY